MKTKISSLIKILPLVAACALSAQGKKLSSMGGEIFEIWNDGKVPGSVCTAAEELTRKPPREFAVNVSVPRLEFFPSKNAQKSGLLLVCPGCGYFGMAVNHEGLQIAKWANERGMSACVLWYRVPDNMQGALQDVQRAIRFARSNAEKWNIDPNKIAVIGFSAGANLCARASTWFDAKAYAPVDGIDKFSARPDLTCLIYPAYCDAPTFVKYKLAPSGAQISAPDYNSEYALAANLPVDSSTPEAFIVQTLDDKNYKNSSVAYALALKKAGVPATLLLCDAGGHGFGLGQNKADKLVSMWPQLLDKLLTLRGFKSDNKQQ